jgi:membrane-bound lytic murein transglycosylase D
MLRAQRRKGNYEAIFNGYRSRIFKFASRNFYSEFLAAREAARDYRLYFGELALDRPLSRETVVMAGYGSLPQIVRLCEIRFCADKNTYRAAFTSICPPDPIENGKV